MRGVSQAAAVTLLEAMGMPDDSALEEHRKSTHRAEAIHVKAIFSDI